MRRYRIGIIVASHIECSMPDDPMYIPVMAGSALRNHVPEGYLRDDTGDNISTRNDEYCELTALYWAWKNLDMDVIGLCHYRRFFASPQHRNHLLSEDEAMHLLYCYDAILPEVRNYYVETNYSQYVHSHHAEDLVAARNIIAEKYPGYIEAYDRRMAMTKGHRFNMLIMKRPLLDEYCRWLFDILFELEEKLDISHYSENDRRVFGFVAERLLDVWMDKNGIRSTDLGYIFRGNEHICIKAAAMIRRKIRGACSDSIERRWKKLRQ